MEIRSKVLSVTLIHDSFSTVFHKQPLYDINFDALTLTTEVMVSPNFLGHTPNDLRLMHSCIINDLFRQFIADNFNSCSLVFTDGSVTQSGAAFAYFFPELHIQSSSNLSSFVFSFTAGRWVILEALTCINFLRCGDFLIVSDSQANILAIVNNPFLSKCFPIILKIRALLLSLKTRLFNIFFVWAPGHLGINGNEHADSLAGSAANQFYSGPSSVPILI